MLMLSTKSVAVSGNGLKRAATLFCGPLASVALNRALFEHIGGPGERALGQRLR